MDNKSRLLMWVGFLMICAGAVLLFITYVQVGYGMATVTGWIGSSLAAFIGMVIFLIGAFRKND